MSDPQAQPDLGVPKNQWQEIWTQFLSHIGALLGGIFFITIVAAVFLGRLVWTHDAIFIDIRARNQSPNWAHSFGTDQLGRDTLARIMAGGQTSITVGLTAMFLALKLGSLVGILARFFRQLDNLLVRLTDLFLALPLVPILLVMMLLFREKLDTAFGAAQGIFILITVSIGITSWMQTARIVRGDVLALKEREFILAARSIGISNIRLILRHILPNVMSPIMVSATLGIANAIITESALSFLGLGFPPNLPHLGTAFERCNQLSSAIS